MHTELLDKLFEIEIVELIKWEKRPHKHNFFELVYIEKGTGLQCINNHEFKYDEGNIFLLPPLDCHSYKIDKPTKFWFIKFNDNYFYQNRALENYSDWYAKITYILANYNKIPGDIISSKRERQYIINSILFIHQEYLTPTNYSKSIISNILASILDILAKSIENIYVENANKKDKRFGEILRYIHTNITDNQKLRIVNLAEKFNISKSYFSEYFKKQAEISLAEYVLKTKLKIVETEVTHSNLSLKELALQLNFTDSSHLAKTFKKTYGMTIKQFKNNNICHTI